MGSAGDLQGAAVEAVWRGRWVILHLAWVGWGGVGDRSEVWEDGPQMQL